MDTLNLKRIDRFTPSPFQTSRLFLDFEVSGVSLYSELRKRNFNYISCLGWVSINYEKEATDRLLMKRAGEMPKGRVGLYVCPECVDPFCGAITISIEESEGKIVWSELAYDNGWESEPDMYVYQLLEGLGPYCFDKADYEKVLLSKDLDFSNKV